MMDMSRTPEMESDEVLRVRLDVMRQEHRDLDDELSNLDEGALSDLFLIKRLKRRKLMLKDLITAIENRLTPDIIA